MRSWSLAAAGASLVGSLVSLPAPAAAKARAHQAARPRAHGAPGVPFEAMQAPPQARPDAAAAVLDDRGLEAFMVAPHADDPSAYFDNEPYAAGAMHEELYARYDGGAASWMPGGGDATEEFVSAGGDTLFRHGSILGGRHAAIHRRGQSSSYADTIAAMGAELSHNPKWLLQNPKWIPSWNRTSAATPVSAPLSVTKTSSAKASKTSTAVVGTSESVPWVLPSPPSSSCASAYTNTDGGGVYAAQVGNVPWSPRPSTFVVRGGNKLYLDGNEFRIVGPNIYWLGLDENVDWTVSYPSRGRIREAMAISVAMGANTIRSHTLGVSTGHPLTLWPDAYETNSKAWETIDYSIWAARNYGLRLIVPLTDNYAYYHGGKYDFIRWAGADTSDGSQFYWNSDVVKIFKDYISVLLNHKNQFTGVKIGEDPTILGFETGNELGGYMLGGGAPPASWTKEIAAHIKSLASNSLVFDGTDGLTTYSGDLGNTGVKVDAVDLVTDHFYPALQWLLEKDQGWMNNYDKKIFYVGELDWTGLKGGSDLATFYSTLENWPGSGSMMWSVFGHDDTCCNYVTHNDGYTLAYPNGLSWDLQAPALALVQHWYRMRGLTPPSALPAVACPQPTLSY
ncbi:hypothetical protein JCM8202_001643 [Rhodotorula sphaerocarpa]